MMYLHEIFDYLGVFNNLLYIIILLKSIKHYLSRDLKNIQYKIFVLL